MSAALPTQTQHKHNIRSTVRAYLLMSFLTSSKQTKRLGRTIPADVGAKFLHSFGLAPRRRFWRDPFGDPAQPVAPKEP